MKIEICQNCGNAFDPQDMDMGFCFNCQPDAGAVLSLEEPPKVDWNALGDCE